MKKQILPPKGETLTSVSFFVPGNPTGMSAMKLPLPKIGTPFIDGLYTIANSGPTQQWKHAIVYAANQYVRNAEIFAPVRMTIEFSLQKKSITPVRLTEYAQVVIETLVETTLLKSASDIYDLKLKKAVGPRSEESYYGAYVRLEHFDPRRD